MTAQDAEVKRAVRAQAWRGSRLEPMVVLQPIDKWNARPF
jgi:hypothetical protein